MSLLWHAALPLKPPLHALVSDVEWIAEHERTASNNTVDLVGVTLSNGGL